MSIVTFDETTETPVAVPPGHDPNAPMPSLRSFFGTREVEDHGPQAFLASIVAPTTVRAHFHRVDQFQIFLGENGAWYQRHDLKSIVVHYADRYTTYGPFGTTAGSLRFFTLRADHSAFTGFMPEARAQLIERGGRNIHVEIDRMPPLEPGESAVTRLISGDDGLEALAVRAGPDATAKLPAAASRLGEYHCFLGSPRAVDDHQYGTQALGWYDRPDAPSAITAGPDGLDVVVLRYPDRGESDAALDR